MLHTFNINSIDGGFQYSMENQYYDLSAYNKHTQLTDIAYSKSQNQSQYIRMPISYRVRFVRTRIITIGITPKYLLKNKNQYNRLTTNDFNRYNLSWSVGLVKDMNPKMCLKFEYSRDFFENLKDRNIYDSSGGAIGKQKSKTNLLTFSISYWIRL